jgi:cation:H+ antiporter
MFNSGYEFFAVPAFIVGVLFLYKGSDILVEGTAKTAARFGISALIISVLLVGFGTSAPEFAISVGAAAQGQQDISLGNIIGSCIANLLLVLGISAIIQPIKIKKGIIRREVPIMVGATFVLLFASITGLLDQYHIFGGILFLVLFIVFVWFFIKCAKKERFSEKSKYEDVDKTRKNLLFIVLGIAGVVFGAWFLIESAITIAYIFNISPFIIALSMVAVGTSLPELVVSATASYKGESDITVGNVLGSNVFNILFIIGVSALFISLGAFKSIDDIIFLIIINLILIPILCGGHTISYKEGVFLIGLYVFYIWYIFQGSFIIPTLFS